MLSYYYRYFFKTLVAVNNYSYLPHSHDSIECALKLILWSMINELITDKLLGITTVNMFVLNISYSTNTAIMQ